MTIFIIMTIIIIIAIFDIIMKTCCVTGNRPQKFPWEYGKGKEHKKYLAGMARQIEKLIESGCTYFISGGALGVDQDFAKAVLKAKKRYADIKLEIAVPCITQATRWGKIEKLRYFYILRQADDVVILSEYYTKLCMLKRNEYMVDKADVVLAYWNGEENGGTWYTINYAKKTNKQLIIINLA